MSVVCEKEFFLKVNPGIFQIVWTVISATPVLATATATANDSTFQLAVAATPVIGSSGIARVKGSFTYNNLTVNPILCNLQLTCAGVYFVTPVNTWRIVHRSSAPIGYLINDTAPGTGVGFTGVVNIPFSIPPGIFTLDDIDFDVQVQGFLGVAGSQTIDGNFQVL